MEQAFRSKTKQFEETYLINAKIGKGFGLYKMIADSQGTNKSEVARRIRKMPYDDFMKTRYWQLVALQVKNDAGWRCEACGSTKGLVAHHVSYRIHGFEMYRVNELQCLCQACHERIHGLRA